MLLPALTWIVAPLVVFLITSHIGNLGTLHGIQQSNDAGDVGFYVVGAIDILSGFVAICLAASARKIGRRLGPGGMVGTTIGTVLGIIVICIGLVFLAVGYAFSLPWSF
jgi:hypothetical protein